MPMDAVDEQLDDARSAFERGDWESARRGFQAAGASTELSLEDLEAHEAAAFRTGAMQESFALSEEYFNRSIEQGLTPQAAMKALDLALMWFNRGDVTISSGWASRARRILRDEPECLAHGYLHYFEATMEIGFGDATAAAAAAETLAEMGQRLRAPGLTAFGLVIGGLLDVRSGCTDDGFAQLDEAILPVLAGQVRPEWGGDIYCTVIHACDQVADVRRMRAWTDAMQRWCETTSAASTFTGICHIHQLQLQVDGGDRETLEQSFWTTGVELAASNGWVAATGFYHAGELRRWRGDVKGATEAYAKVRELGGDPQPGDALLHLDAGRVEVAWTGIRGALDAADDLGRVPLLLVAAEVALARGAEDDAASLCRELEEKATAFGSEGFLAWARHCRGALLVAGSDPDAGLTHLQAALRHYREQNSRYDTARVYEWMGRAHRALGDTETASAVSAAAADIYRQLGRDDEGTIGGLTPRELDILRRVAAGASNKDVAATAYISEKTVSRHLANIYLKIGVSSRTAAVAWAREHDLV